MTYEGKYKALFDDDIAGGGVRLQCENCDHQFVSTEKWGEQLVCPHCKETLRYPEGASW